MDRQQWWQRCNNSAATNGKQQSTNVQHVQRQTSNNGRMRWRATAAEVTWQMKQQTSNYDRWRRGNNNAGNNDKNQQSTNVRRQRRRTYAAAEAEDNDGWRSAGHGSRGAGATVVRRWRRNSSAIKAMEDGGRRLAAGVFSFSILSRVESYLKSYLDKS
jgi:hypothetical protein